jgi:hypothetical protein
MNFRHNLMILIRESLLLKPEPLIALYPHKHYHGYYINPKNLDVYSIKSGTLKKMKASVWNGETYVTLSHKGHRKHLIVKYLKSSINYNPADSIDVSVKLG